MRIIPGIRFGPHKPGRRLPPRPPDSEHPVHLMRAYDRKRQAQGLGPLMPRDMEQASKDLAALVNAGTPLERWPEWARVVLGAAIAYRYPRPWRMYPGSPWAFLYDYEAHKARMILRLVAPLPLMGHPDTLARIRAWAERMADKADWGERCFADQVRAELPKRARRRITFESESVFE